MKDGTKEQGIPTLVQKLIELLEAPRPLLLSSRSTQVQNIIKDGNYVYMAEGRTDLRILDISDFNVPREVDAFGPNNMTAQKNTP